jgi:hypothetical protein
MPRTMILTRNCSGIRTRIECEIRLLAGGRGLWTLLCAAGMNDAQPSTIKAQGPFHGPCVAEGLLESIATSLALQGYEPADGPAIWRLHIQAELRKLNAESCCHPGDFQFRPES